jgi:K+-transporting ATPase A subunit
MTVEGWIQIVVLIAALTALTSLLAGYIARVYQGERLALTPVLAPVERIAYRIFGFTASKRQGWEEYARALLLFSAAGWLVLYPILRTQGGHPAGSLGPRRIAPSGLGRPGTDSPRFVILLIGFVAIFAVLTFLTVLVPAPFAQALNSHLLM